MSLRIAELVDVSTFLPSPDGELLMDLTGRRIAGPRVVLEWVARSWLTPRGALVLARGRGVDLRQLENATLDATSIARWQMALSAEARAVEFVAGCAVSVRRVERNILIQAEVVLVDGRSYPLAVKLSEAARLVDFGGVM